MKHLLALFTVLLLAAFIAGCSSAPSGTSAPPVDSTVENLFTKPEATTTAPNTTQAQSVINTTPATTEPPATTPAPPEMLGSIAIGSAKPLEKDNRGPFTTYSGGEMVLPFMLDTTGSIANNGVGILLFIDGQPQPYKAEGKDYAYLHTFFPIPGKSNTVDLSFIPVTGKQGDDLEIYALSVLHPDYSLKDGVAGFTYTSGSVAAGFRLKYEQTPPDVDFALEEMALSSVNTQKVDSQYSEIAGWSEYDLQEMVEAHLYVNDTPENGSRLVYGVKAGTPVDLRFELWGSPYVHFSVVFFVDNQPLWDETGNLITVDVESGQKTVVQASLELPDFDGESVVYAVLVPRNYRSSEVRTTAFLEARSPFFLLEGEKPE